VGEVNRAKPAIASSDFQKPGNDHLIRVIAIYSDRRSPARFAISTRTQHAIM
jgi:hypothetical protein